MKMRGKQNVNAQRKRVASAGTHKLNHFVNPLSACYFAHKTFVTKRKLLVGLHRRHPAAQVIPLRGIRYTHFRDIHHFIAPGRVRVRKAPRTVVR